MLKRPTPERYDSVTIGTYDGTNEYIHGDFGGPIDKDGKFGYRINLLGQNGGTAVDDQSLKRYLVSGAFDFHIAPNLLLQVEAAHREERMNGDDQTWAVVAGVPYPSAPNADKLYSPNWTYNDVRDNRASANLKWDISDVFTVRSAYLWKDDDRSYVQAKATLQKNGTWNEVPLKAAPFEMIQESGYLFGDAHFNTGFIKHTLTVGFSDLMYYSKGPKDANSNFTVTGISFANLTNTSQPNWAPTGDQAFYMGTWDNWRNWSIGDDIKLNEQWSALVGVNRTEIQQQGFNTSALKTSDYGKAQDTPTASLIYKPIPWISTYATYMEALEQGAIVGTGYSNTGTVLPPLLDRQYEVGAKATVGGMLLTTALFRIEEGAQYSNNTTPLPTYVQDGKEVHQGVEFTATGKVMHDVTLVGGFTIFDATLEKNSNPLLIGKTPVNVAQQFAKLYAEYSLPWIKGLTLTGGGYWEGDQYADTMNTQKLGSYIVGDLGARYETKIYSCPTIFRLNVTNVADTSYWISSYQVGNPRSVAFSMQVKF